MRANLSSSISTESQVDFPSEEAGRLVAHLPAENQVNDAEDIYYDCTCLPGLSSGIRDTPCLLVSSDHAEQWLHLFLDVWWLIWRKKPWWGLVLEARPFLEEAVLGVVPESRTKLLSGARHLLHYCADPEALRPRVSEVVDALRRLASPPFHPEYCAFAHLECFLGISDVTLRSAFMRAPDQSFVTFEHACRRDSTDALVGRQGRPATGGKS